MLYTSGNSTAISAAVQAGLAVTVLAESALRPGMRVLSEADGFPRLPTCEIGIIRSWHRPTSAIVDKLAEHIVSSLDNLSVPAAASPPDRRLSQPHARPNILRPLRASDVFPEAVRNRRNSVLERGPAEA